MTIMTAMVLLQAPVAAVVPQRSAELDAANDCLVAQTRQWLGDKSSAPSKNERWRWAQIVVGRCDEKIVASVPAAPAQNDALTEAGAVTNISPRDLRRSEALYYVDGMIAAHFEGRE